MAVLLQSALGSSAIRRISGHLTSTKAGFWWQWLFAAYTSVSIIVNALGNVAHYFRGDIAAQSQAILLSDRIDRPLIFAGIQSKSTFLSTFSWYHETWAGIVPFWRPLTSQFFWLEYHAFTPERFVYAQLVLALSHIICAALLALFAYQLTGKVWIGTLSALIFAGSINLPPWSWLVNTIGFPMQFPFDTASVCVVYWKDQPEAWTGACILFAIVMALRGRWAWSLAGAAAAICFKENGWYVFLLVPLALLGAGRLRAIPKWTYLAGFVLAVILLVLRACAGWAVFFGYHQGHEVNWAARYLTGVEGPYFGAWQTVLPSAILASALFALCLWKKANFWVRFPLALASIAACAQLDAFIYHGSMPVGLAMLLTWDIGLSHVAKAFIWLVMVYAVCRSREYRPKAFALGAMILISAVSVASASQVTGHVLYLTYALQSILAALTCAALAQWGSTLSQARLKRASSNVAPASEIA